MYLRTVNRPHYIITRLKTVDSVGTRSKVRGEKGPPVRPGSIKPQGLQYTGKSHFLINR